MLQWLKDRVKSAVDWAKNAGNAVKQNPVVQNVARTVAKPFTDVYNGVRSGLNKPTGNAGLSGRGNPADAFQQRAKEQAAAEAAARHQVAVNKANALANVWKERIAPKSNFSSLSQKPATMTPNWAGWKANLRNLWDSAVTSRPAQWIGNSKAGKWLYNNTPLKGVTNLWSEYDNAKWKAENYNRQMNDAADMFDKRQSRGKGRLRDYEIALNRLYDDFKAGRINYRDARAREKVLIEAADNEGAKIEKLAKIYNNSFAEQKDEYTQPVQFNPNGVVPWLKKVYTYGDKISIKGAWTILTTLMNLPSRGENTLKNWLDYKKPKPGYKTPYYDGESYTYDPNKSKWANAWAESAKQKNPFWSAVSGTSFGDNNIASKEISDTLVKRRPWGKVADWVGENFFDPTTLIPNGLGFGLWDEGSKALQGTKTFQRAATAWDKADTPVVNMLKWLWKRKDSDLTELAAKKQKVWEQLDPTIKKRDTLYNKMQGFWRKYRDVGEDAPESTLRKRNYGLEGLNDNEIEAYQRSIVLSGWRNTDKIVLHPSVNKWIKQGIDIDKDKVVRAIYKNRSRWARMAEKDKAAGLVYEQGARSGYEPIWSGHKGLLDPDKVDEHLPWYAKSRRVSYSNRNRSLEDIVRSRLSRERGFLRKHEIKPYYDEYLAEKNVANELKSELDTVTKDLNKAKKTPWRQFMKVAGFPNKVWKSSVLAARPAWYVNNFAHNIAASVMGAGFKVSKAYKEILEHPELLKAMPEEIVGNTMFGKENIFQLLGKPGSAVENLSRGAMYKTLIDKGWTKEAAIKQVNRYLFDYGNVRNWERPIKSVIPFWQWQKNIAKFTATLPLNNPRAARIYTIIKNEFMDKPLKEIPDEENVYTDPETKEVIKWNPRKAYEGKIKTPWGWRTTPFLPIMPGQLDQVGLAPWISLSEELLTGKDRFGNDFKGIDSVWDRLLKVFPQYQLYDAGKKALNNTGVSEKWISDSGYTKERQGYDPSRPNYIEKLDTKKNFWNTLGSFTGFGTYKNFDKADYEEKKRYNAFTRDYFSRDFDKEFPVDPKWDSAKKTEVYNAKQAAKEAVAKKHGYQLERDIYNGKWRKYDTDTTLKAKISMETNQAKRQGFYKETTTFWKNFFAESNVDKRMDMLLNNPKYLKEGSKEKILAGRAKHAFWQKFFAMSSMEERMAYLKANPQYMKESTKKKIAFWDKYHAADKLTKRYMKKDHPEYFTKEPDMSTRNGKLAWAYENLNPIARKKWIKEQGLASEGPVDYVKLAAEKVEKRKRDEIINPNMKPLEEKHRTWVKRTYKQKVRGGKDITFSTRKKPIDKNVWKVK